MCYFRSAFSAWNAEVAVASKGHRLLGLIVLSKLEWLAFGLVGDFACWVVAAVSLCQNWCGTCCETFFIGSLIFYGLWVNHAVFLNVSVVYLLLKISKKNKDIFSYSFFSQLLPFIMSSRHLSIFTVSRTFTASRPAQVWCGFMWWLTVVPLHAERKFSGVCVCVFLVYCALLCKLS